MFVPLNGVPFNHAHIMTLADRNYKNPAQVSPADLTFMVAIDGSSYAPLSHKGALRCADPRDVLARGATDEVAEAWRHVFRSATLIFKVLKTDVDIWFHQEQARQKIITTAGVVTMTALQRIRQVYCLKEKIERNKGSIMSVEDFHEALSKVGFSEFSEP
eukprot:13792125-Heterocapsa_arctica.AAC.1